MDGAFVESLRARLKIRHGFRFGLEMDYETYQLLLEIRTIIDELLAAEGPEVKLKEIAQA